MSNKFFLFIFLCLITNASLYAKNIYVNDNSQTGDVFTYSVGLASNNGLTKSTPKLTLTDALTIAAANDSIYIDAGTYNNEVNLNLTINGVKIVGAGYSATIIDNLYAGTATNYFMYINANNITLKDFKVTGYENNGTQTPGHSGQAITIGGGASPISGILIENIEAILNGQSGGNPAISVLANTTATITGAGSFCNTAGTAYTGGVEAYGKNINLLIADYLLGDNYKVGAFDGGALRIEGDATTLVTVKRTLISKNIASQGGGISVINGDLKMYDCVIDNNSAGQVSSNIYGGGVFINAGTVLFSRCYFKNNFQASGTLRGGAISARYLNNSGAFSTNKIITLTIDTCVFQNNSPGTAGMDIYGANGFSNACNITARDCQFLTAGNFNIFSDGTSPASSINVTYFGTLPTSSGSNVTRTLSTNTLYTPPLLVPEYSGSCPNIYIGPCTPTVSILSVSSPTICSGNSTVITPTASPSGAASYTLNPGNLVGTSFTVSPSSNTTYTLTGTSAAGCVSANSVTRTIIVNTTPTVSIASVSSPSICSGNSTVITPTANPTGASSYTLNPGALTGTSFTVSPTSSQTYTLTGTSAAGCVSANSATRTIVVNTTPTVSIASVSNPTLCSGNSSVITPTANPTGASSYTLNPGALTGTSFTVSPLSNQTYTLTGTSAAGCVSANSVTTTISVNITPTVSIVSVSNQTICSGNSTVITPTANPTSASSYTLNPGALTGNSFTVNPTSNQTYSLTGTSAAGCLSANSATTTITVNATPTVSIFSVSNPTICSGNSTVITPTASPSGASSYTLNPGALTGTSFTVSPTSNQTYTLTGTSAAGCLSANTATRIIIVNTTPTVAILSVSNPTICSGNLTIITPTANPSGAGSYTLNPGALVGTNFTVSPNANTTYTLTGISAAGCLSANDATTNITVNTTPTVAIASVSSGTICSGNTVTISPSSSPVAASSYTLNPGGLTGTSFTVSPLINTTYSLSGTSAAGCVSSNTATRTIVVNTTPTVNIATNNLSLCSGNPLVMPVVSGGTVILWQGPNSFTSSLAQPTVTNSIGAIHAGNYSVTVAQTYGANTCTSSVAQVTVSVVTSVNIGVTGGQSQNLCIGSILNVIPTGGNTYTLQPGNTIALSYTLNPTTNSTYTLIGSAGNGCDGSTTFSININPLPIISITPSSTSICSGNSATLSASSGSVAANTYTWSSNAGSANTPTISVSPVSNETYTVTGTNALTGCTNTATQSVLVNTTPTVGIASVSSPTICSGNSTIITPNGANTYTLNPGALVGTSFTVNPTSNQTYSISGTSIEGCLSDNEATTDITVNNMPTVGIASVSSPTICSGNSTVITPNGANTYTLNPGALVGTSFTVNPTSNQTYSITGTSAEGCLSGNEATTDITVNTTPTVGIASVSSPTICPGNSTVITPNGANTYTLNPGALVGTSFTVNPTSNQTYSISGTSIEGCLSDNEATTDITVNTTPTVGIASVSSPTICSGNSTVITPNGANSYTLNPGALVGTSFTVNPTNNQTYSITGTSAEGCLSGNEATTDITVNTTPTASAVSNPTTVCTTGSVNLTGSSSSAASTYTWTLGNGITPLNQNNSSVVFSASSLTTGSYVYTLTISSAEGCPSGAVTTTVNIINTPNSSFSLSTLSTCQNQTSVISIDNAQSGVNYSWTINGINSSSSSSVNIGSPLTSSVGVYPISVLAVIGTCSSTSTANFTVNPNPSIALINTNIVACPDDAVQLEVLNPVLTSNYSWSFGSSVVGSGNIYSINPLTTSNAGVYSVRVTDINGCQAQTNAQVETKDCFVFVPEIFTPNGDGKNDSFVITNIQNYPNNNLKIFNRWGSLVYEKDKYNNEFDGHANVSAAGSDKLPAGTYYVILNFNDGKTETYNGYLLLQY